ncbi:MAG: alanyl-tRNA editing protein [Bryobacteraceae bacterium]
MTERLYYHDSYLTEFDAHLLEASDGGTRVLLDRTAFYPASGGQPFDTGTLNGVRVTAVEEDDAGRVVHVLESPLPEAGQVHGVIDWARRFEHMQQHTGQHLLSAVFEELFGFRTVSFHMGAAASTIELDAPLVTPEQLAAAERRANELVWQDVPVRVSFEDAAAEGLRKEPGREGVLRIITIEGIDRSACGGTHVRSTGQIGAVLVRRTERIRGQTRVEFLCGVRAIGRARADYTALDRTARLFSAALDDVPQAAAAALEQAKEAEKARRKLALELAELRGRALYAACAPDGRGLRVHVERIEKGPISDELRALAQSFCAGGQGVFVGVCTDPPSILLATGEQTGIEAGARLKAALEKCGGRGGGSARIAQGSLPSAEVLEALVRALAQR